MSGVHLLFNAGSISSLCAAGMLSPSGRCQALSGDADGYVRGEAAISMVLQSTGDVGANSQEHSVAGLSILSGSSVNQDGRSSSLTAPNGQSQQAVLSDAWHSASQKIVDMQAVALHGTGTALGDPIEVGALMHCVSPSSRQAPLLMQANKASIGHGEAAAGISSLYYTTLLLGQKAFKPVVHLRSVNPHVSAALPRDSHTCMPLLPRLEASISQTSPAACGVSSFAYQVSVAGVALPCAATCILLSMCSQPAQPVLLQCRAQMRTQWFNTMGWV